MIWLLCGYMWLFIHRPFEIWPWLGEIHLERVYMSVMLCVWLAVPKRFAMNRLHLAFILMAGVILMCWFLSPFSDAGQVTVENFLKVAVFYLLVVTTVHDERNLKILVAAFLLSMSLYMVHSLREYFNGRHVWRMGTKRMLGVDSSFGDPNTFSASILYSLPMLLPFWHLSRKAYVRYGVLIYLFISVLCIGLSGSRTGIVVLIALSSITMLCSRKRLLWLMGLVVAAPLLFFALPSDRQDRIMTIFDPSRGPQNAQTSADARRIYFEISVDLWQDNLITGVGPNGFRVASGTGNQAHSLYGQVISELGMLGVVVFLFVLGCFYFNARDMKQLSISDSYSGPGFLFYLSRSIWMAVLLMLVGGLGGHNLYRHNWIWYGAFQVIALQCAAQRVGLRAVSSGLNPRYQPARQC